MTAPSPAVARAVACRHSDPPEVGTAVRLAVPGSYLDGLAGVVSAHGVTEYPDPTFVARDERGKPVSGRAAAVRLDRPIGPPPSHIEVGGLWAWQMEEIAP